MNPAQFLALILLADALLILSWWLAFDKDPPPETPAEPEPKPMAMVFEQCGHTYMARFWPGQEREVARALGRWAADEGVPLTIEEALAISERLADEMVVSLGRKEPAH